MAELLIAANLLMLACLAECVFGRRLLLRAICGGLSSVFSGLSAGLLVHLYSLSGGPDAGRAVAALSARSGVCPDLHLRRIPAHQKRAGARGGA